MAPYLSWQATAQRSALYSSEFWNPTQSQLQKLDSAQYKAGKAILNLRKSTAGLIVGNELGLLPFKYLILREKIRFYYRLWSLPQERIAKQFFERKAESFQFKDNWRKTTRSEMRALRARFPTLQLRFPAGNDNADALKAGELLWEQALKEAAWQDTLTAANGMSTIGWYTRFRVNPGYEMRPLHYNRDIAPSQARCMIRIYTRSLVTLHDAENWGILGAERYDRRWPDEPFCKFCDDDVTEEDIEHIVFDCPQHRQLRRRLRNELSLNILPSFSPDLSLSRRGLKHAVTLALSGGEHPPITNFSTLNADAQRRLKKSIEEAGVRFCKNMIASRHELLWSSQNQLPTGAHGTASTQGALSSDSLAGS